MPATQHQHHCLTLEDLMVPHRETIPVRCNYCGRDGADRDFDMVQEALRGRIRMLESRLCDLESMLAGRD